MAITDTGPDDEFCPECGERFDDSHSNYPYSCDECDGNDDEETTT